MRTLFFAGVLCALTGCVFDPPGDCLTAADCVAGARCDQNVCVMGCEQDTHCANWEGCDTATKRCVPYPGRCSAESHCNAWEDCDTAANTCQVTAGSCNVTEDCQDWEYCSESYCLLTPGFCYTNADCGGMWAACDEQHRCSVVAPAGNDIILWGALSPGYCGAYALSPVARPSDVSVGFDGCFSDTAMTRSNGVFVYIDDEDFERSYLRVFARDSWRREDDRWQYPANAQSNDSILPTPGCPTGPTRFVNQAQTTAYTYSCSGSVWYDGAGNTLVEGKTVLAWNRDGDMLLGNSYLDYLELRKPDGTLIPATGLPSGRDLIDARSNSQGDGFIIALGNFSSPYINDLWKMDSTGQVTLQGTYGETEKHLYGALLDTAGALYTTSFLSGGVDIILKHPPDGTPAQEIYSEADAPEGANDTRETTLRLYNLMHGSNLVRGP